MAKAKPKPISDLSDDELMAQWTDINEQLAALRDQGKELSKEFHTRERKKVLEQQLGNLNDTDRELLSQMIAVPSIESEEGVNGD